MGMTQGHSELRRRATMRRRRRHIKRAGIVIAIGMCVAVLPTPQFDFVEEAFGVQLPFPQHRVASAAEVEESQAAIRDHHERVHDESVGVSDERHSHDDHAHHDHPHDDHAHHNHGDDDHEVIALEADRVIGTADADTEFTIIGLTYDEIPAEPAVVRVQTVDGAWGDWQPLIVNLDEGPDHDSDEFSNLSTEPLYTGDAIAYEISVPETDVDHVDVTVVENQTHRVTRTAAADATEDMQSSRDFDVKSRSSWGARTPKETLSAAPAAKFGVVHHTAGSNGYSQAAVPGIIRGVQAYHMDGRGWSDIGYNFIVDRFGTIWEGRANSLNRATVGAHAAGFNTGSVGVSLLGDYTSAQSAEASRTAASRIISWVLWRDNQPTSGSVTVVSGGSTRYSAGQSVTLSRVVGHRDVGMTTCPGSVHGHFSTMRAQVSAFASNYGLGERPIGGVSITADEGEIAVTGWAFDRDAYLEPVQINIHFNSRTRTILANEWNSPVGSRYPEAGKYTGFSAVYNELPKGATNVCVTAVNLGPRNQNTLMSCEMVVVK